MLTFIAFLVAIGVLVTFHELGHFWVARLCGVKVLRFSVGFGKPLCTFQRGDTEWAISPIPLGGYVRMLDEREMEVPPGSVIWPSITSLCSSAWPSWWPVRWPICCWRSCFTGQ